MTPSTSPSKREPLDRASFGLFDVYFIYDNAGRNWNDEYFTSIAPLQAALLKEIRVATLWAVERQNREYESYWDALTWLEGPARPRRLSRIPEIRLVDRVMRSLASDQEDQGAIKRLAEEPALRNITTMHTWEDAKFTIKEAQALARTDPARIRTTRRGNQRLAQPTMCRAFRVPMGDAGGSLRGVDLDRQLVLTLLVQIRSDLELFYETGFRRLRRCERDRCGAWYVSKPMGQQIRFCCNVCRASEYRESRTATKRRSKALQHQR
ncbi:MAG: hypothetical protein IIA64_02280 [Planctomycetes bacterium]|nr:hypothetical protein [Planctomycetota bacterium]